MRARLGPPFMLVLILSMFLYVAIPWFTRGRLLAQLRSSAPEERARGVKKLGEIFMPGKKSNEIVNVLIAVTRDSDPRVRKAAVKTLPNWARPKITEALMSSLYDPDPGVREEAVRGLGILKVKAARAVLTEVMSKDWNPNVRETVSWALNKIGPEEPAVGEQKHARTPIGGVRLIGSILGAFMGTLFVWKKFGWVWGILTAIGAILAIKQLIF